MQKARVDIDKNSTLWYRPRRKTPLEFDSAGESRTVAGQCIKYKVHRIRLFFAVCDAVIELHT